MGSGSPSMPHLTDRHMKNFSTVGARIVVAALISGTAASGAQAATCRFLPNAPDQHIVAAGDTLWDISARFLEHAWCWGEVWGLNRAEIRDPHWIYPGQVVYFDRSAGRLRLGTQLHAGSDERGSQLARLSPQLRTEGLGKDAVPSIPAGVIEPFLSQPLIVEADELSKAPRIVAGEENHLFLGADAKAYVRGDLNGGTSFQVFRPGQPLTDPVTNAVLGYEAFYLGTVKLRAGAQAGSDVHTFTVASSKQEMGVGDRLLPAPPTPMRNYAPHPPSRQVDARIMSIYGGVTYAGQNSVVSVNRGALDGLDIGAVLQLYHKGETVPDTTATAGKGWFGMGKPMLKLPDEQYGSLFIFRVFKHISYGLVMQVTEPVRTGDVAKSPE
jgi:hypothetical protein